jgi:hypothetical protein
LTVSSFHKPAPVPTEGVKEKFLTLLPEGRPTTRSAVPVRLSGSAEWFGTGDNWLAGKAVGCGCAGVATAISPGSHYRTRMSHRRSG